MLRIIGRAETIEERVEVGNYVPLTIHWGRSRGPYLYWRSGDLRRSFHELGLDPSTGHVRSFTLTLVGPSVQSDAREDLSGLPVHTGCPVFDLRNWPPGDWENGLARYVDEPQPFVVRITSTSVSVAFADLSDSTNVFRVDRTHFFADAVGYLLGLEVRGLTAHESAVLHTALAQ